MRASPVIGLGFDGIGGKKKVSPDNPDRFRGFVDQLIWTRDPYMVLADFKSYARCQQTVEAAYRDTAAWTRTSIVNVARMGRFSSDRAVRGYAREIWGVL